ncbi:MAG TPA: pantoate--beta-alanine ligase [Symbiobacteriaceae bacterium]|jgi:pantoate--beta-alanine ligase|nr:pantoate--beta-alanine ligase [Symbiobacteriaceae bacterium]
MLLLDTVAGVREAVKAARRTGKRIGFVPTMGYLHDGHLALMRQARAECDFVVVSIFVNPTQFGPGEDFDRYPRDLERDQALCQSVPVDAIFHPSVAEMYPPGSLTRVQVSGITETLCGASRPGHFEGVATVVTKLFNIVAPDVAYFGQKDAQQVAVIRRMVRDLNMDLEIRPVPTVREPDGLAMSSRNAYLSPEDRQAALVLSRSLQLAQARVAAGGRDLAAIRSEMAALIAAEPRATIDYVSIVDYDTLQPVDRLLEGKALAALAVRFGKTRLIDNCVLEA